MIRDIHIINGHQYWEGFAEGQLTGHFIDTITEVLKDANINYTVTAINDGYDLDYEVNRLFESDIIIMQFPMYWMGLPWLAKKYIDEVFMHGHAKLYRSDGRDVEGGLYGSGGLLTSKYMLSITANAPLEAFSDKNQFFHGVGVDGAFAAVHNSFRSIGATPLPTFIANDIFKNPTIADDSQRLRDMIKNLLK